MTAASIPSATLASQFALPSSSPEQNLDSLTVGILPPRGFDGRSALELLEAIIAAGRAEHVHLLRTLLQGIEACPQRAPSALIIQASWFPGSKGGCTPEIAGRVAERMGYSESPTLWYGLATAISVSDAYLDQVSDGCEKIVFMHEPRVVMSGTGDRLDRVTKGRFALMKMHDRWLAGVHLEPEGYSYDSLGLAYASTASVIDAVQEPLPLSA